MTHCAEISSRPGKRFAPAPTTEETLTILRDERIQQWLWNGSFRGADLNNAKLNHAILSSAKLRYVVLSDAQLQGAELKNAELSCATLTRAELQNARLDGADLCYADLRNAKLQNAHLEDADLRFAHLEGADLTGAFINEHTKFEKTTYNDRTIRPNPTSDPNNPQFYWPTGESELINVTNDDNRHRYYRYRPCE